MSRRMKGTGKATDESQRRSERSVSPIVGIILLFGMVAIAATVIAISGMALVDSLQSDAAEKQGVNELNQLDHTLRTQGFDNDDVRSFVLSDDLGDYEMNADGRLFITAKGQFGSNATVVNTTLQTIELETGDGQTVAYQGGGIFSGDADGSAVRSDPALQYRTQTDDGVPTKQLSFSLVDLRGDVGTGENVVKGQSRAQSRDQLEDIRYVSGVEIRIEGSTYHHGWNTFLTDEFGSSAVTHFESNQTVVVDAAIDHDRPFTQYVEIYPKIYGGLHTESTESVTLQQADLSVDGYDSRIEGYNASNATTDLFTVDTDDELQLQSQADIDGLPISNGDIRAQPGATVTPFAFYADADTSPAGTDVLTAELNSSFESVEPITDEITDQAIDLLDEEGTQLPSSNPTPGMYYANGDATLSNKWIETGSGGSVHIGVDGDLSLDNVDVNGTGQVHIYVTGNISLSEVSVLDDDRASALWIYGTEDADITVSDEVQGVVYAPGSDSLTLKDGAEVYGSLVGGEPTFEGDAAVHFDRSLRSALPLSNSDLSQNWTSTEPNELDVSFVLDSTGSMAWNDPDDLTKPATQNAIGMLEAPYHRAGVYEFDTSGRALHEISGDLAAVNGSVEANEDGGTNISTGIERALDGHALVEDGREKHMILMTDGKNEPGCWFTPPEECQEQADNATMQQAQRAAENGVTIWTIAFSENADSELMEDIADETGGDSTTVTDASEIEGVMEQFLDEVIDEEETVELEVNLDFEANPRTNHEAFDVQTFTFNIDSD